MINNLSKAELYKKVFQMQQFYISYYYEQMQTMQKENDILVETLEKLKLK